MLSTVRVGPTAMQLVVSLALCSLAHSLNATAIWSSAADGSSPNYVLLRPPTLQLNAVAATMKVMVSAAPDPVNQGQLLGLYRLFVNGVHVAIGPGRGNLNMNSNPNATVFDSVDVPASILENSGTQVTVALQCLNQNNSKNAWTMLKADIRDVAGNSLAQVSTNADWL